MLKLSLIFTTTHHKSASVDTLRTNIIDSLTKYSKDVDMNRFGGRFKYSKILQLIDRVDTAITSNITKVKIRRDMKALVNQFAQYEICLVIDSMLNQMDLISSLLDLNSLVKVQLYI